MLLSLSAAAIARCDTTPLAWSFARVGGARAAPSGVTVFSTTSGSSTPTCYAAFTTPVAAIQLTMNALSSAGGKATATILQAGIG
jgi:hypothetical protein